MATSHLCLWLKLLIGKLKAFSTCNYQQKKVDNYDYINLAPQVIYYVPLRPINQNTKHMKKIILTVSMAICALGLFAQDASSGSNSGAYEPKSKHGEMILPEAGDWAVTFDASPFLKYIGNFLSPSGNQAPTLSFLGGSGSNYTIVGKYYVDAQTAYRGLLRIGFNSNSLSQVIPEDNPPAGNPPFPTVTDKLSVSSYFIGVGAGIEKRKGHTRLQGYYGAEVMLWIASGGNDSSMTYGNTYSATATPNSGTGNSQSPSFYNFANGTREFYTFSPIPSQPSSGRITKDAPGSVFGLSLQGFIGIEYFIMPKISIGAEYTWGINFWTQGEGTRTTEIIYAPNGGGNNVDANVTYKTNGAGHFGIDTGVNPSFGTANGTANLGAADLNIIFHFQ